MKNYLIILAALSLFSCKNAEEPTFMVFSGNVQNSAAESAKVRGNDFEASLPISEGGSFSDTLYLPKDGFYNLTIGRESTGIYLENGGDLTVNLDANLFDETLVYGGSLAAENNFIAQKYLWNERHNDLKTLYSSTETDFLQKLSSNKKAIDSIFESKNITNEQFKSLLATEDEYALAVHIEDYQQAHRYYTANDTFTASGALYEQLKGIDYTDTSAFRNSATYQSLLSTHFNRLAAEETQNSDANLTLVFMKKVDAALPDGYAKDKIMSDYLRFGLQPDEALDEVFAIYKNSNPNPENLAVLAERYNKLKTLTTGNPSPTFNFENHKGGTTSLEDLKGKYVYIDVWATWCGPCKREIPFLKEIEASYRDENIAIVSISIDERKDYETWRAMVSEKELGGIQLMADNNWNSDFVGEYAILGIPRFILVDPQGNIVSADAPRPSDPKLREMLDTVLALKS